MFPSILLFFAPISGALAGLLWVLDDAPAAWEWVSIILGATSLSIAGPALLQGLYGSPHVNARIESYAEGATKSLVVFVENTPVRTRLLKLLGVKRESIQSLTASFRISETGSGKILLPVRQARIYSDDDSTDIGRDRISLPPTFSVAASFLIAVWGLEGNNAAIVPPHRNQASLVIPPGYYLAEIVLQIDGHPIRMPRRFIVGATGDDLRWA